MVAAVERAAAVWSEVSAPARERAPLGAAAPQEGNGSVLVVDDEAPLRKLVAVALRRGGYDVTLAADGREALARVAAATPDLIVSDVMMPGMDGLELLARLPANPATRAIPLILLTAKGATEDKVAGLDLGADDYLPKPFQLTVLLARVPVKVERPLVPREELPHDRPTNLLAERPLAGDRGPMMGRLVIYEDEDAIRTLIGLSLRATPHALLFAADGVEGLALIERRRPDLVITDVRMPRLDGFGLCEAVRARPDLPRLPVLLLTASVHREELEEGFRRGATDYLIKPFTAAELRAKVAALVGAADGAQVAGTAGWRA